MAGDVGDSWRGLSGDAMSNRVLRQWESPPTWLLLFLALAWGQGRYLPLIDAGRAGRIVGLLAIVAGALLLFAAVMQFRRHHTTIMPREVPRA